VKETLDCGLDLVVSVQVDWESCGVQFLLELGLEGRYDHSSFNVGIRCPHVAGVHSSHFNVPVVEDYHLLSQISDVYVSEL